MWWEGPSGEAADGLLKSDGQGGLFEFEDWRIARSQAYADLGGL